MSAPKAQAFLKNIASYLPGKAKINGRSDVIKLSSNENPNGASPHAINAYQSAAQKLHRYPEDGALCLREAISALHGFAIDQLICGAGSDDIIRMLCAAYGGVGREVIYPQYGFAMYPIYAQQSGAKPISAPAKMLHCNIESILQCVSEKTSLVFIASPNNPTGDYITKEQVHRLRQALREDIILVLDGAYAEYVNADDYTDGRELVASSNTVIMRTFSKAYGLGSLRIGWGYGPREIIQTLYKVRSPFNLTQPSLHSAIAALGDQDYIARHVAENNAQRIRLERELSQLALRIHPCHANFVLAECEDAAAINNHLAAHGIIVRELGNYALPHFLRITVGTPAENDALIAAMKAYQS